MRIYAKKDVDLTPVTDAALVADPAPTWSCSIVLGPLLTRASEAVLQVSLVCRAVTPR